MLVTSAIITVLFTVCYYHFKGIASKRNEQGQDQKEETEGIQAVLDLWLAAFSENCSSLLSNISGADLVCVCVCGEGGGPSRGSVEIKEKRDTITPLT